MLHSINYALLFLVIEVTETAPPPHTHTHTHMVLQKPGFQFFSLYGEKRDKRLSWLGEK